ncbi:MAG: 2-aminoadipate transaminase [Firmicutes bacterium]|nr:2-aminoadipate transaminase [candidate division NPL-UPA2 bacterium]MBT9153708.1 2-aminoadipate transaminase [candidate division NPL-UPA2 bacterium]
MASLDLSRNKPLYQSLAEQLKREASSHPAHTRLPSVRALAREHCLNPSTVVAALRVLEQEGLVYCREGSGTYLAPKPAVPPVPAEAEQVDIDFTSGTPSPEFFPVDEFKAAFNTVLDRDRGQAFAYPELQGYGPLRHSIAAYLAQQGLTVNSEHVHITSGAQQAIFLLAQLLLAPGALAVVESPCYPGAMQAFQAVGARVVGVPIGQTGLRLAPLQQALRHAPRLVYTIPNYHNPTGAVYGADIRKKLVQLARERDFYIIEDDHISELYYTPTRPPLLWQEAPDRVLFVKSFSKMFMPGLRLGFIVVPPQLMSHVRNAKKAVDIGSSGLTQRALDLYLRSGHWDKHQALLRSIYRERASVLYNALKRHWQGTAVFHPLRGGMNCWVGLPDGSRASDLLKLTATQGVLFSPGDDFSVARQEYRNFLRISIAGTFPERIERGIALMARIWHSA